MIQRTPFNTACTALTVGLICFAGAADADAAGFRIMSDEEVASHQMAMQALSGQAREEYRNAQYAKLRQRAREAGYRMPETPPWQAAQPETAPEAAPVPGADRSAATADSDAAARHAAMRDKLQARRDALQQSAAANSAQLQAGKKTVPIAEPAPGTAPEASAPPVTEPAPVEVVADTPDSEPPPAEAPQPPEAAEAPQPADTTEPPVATIATPAPTAPTATPVQPIFAPAEIAAPDTHEVTAPPAAPEPPASPSLPEPPAMPTGELANRYGPAPVTALPTTSTDGAEAPSASPVDAYRDTMRSRFDSYMQERQAQREEALRRQREQHEAALEQSREQRNRFAPYPSGPSYGPRYPAAFPGYRTPYWQQPLPPQRPQPPQPPQAPQGSAPR